MPDTREFVIRRTGYLAIYKIDDNAVIVLRIVHGHQNWPPAESG